MQIKNYNYNKSKINTFISDSYLQNFIWIGFEKEDNYCTLQKVSANNPLQVYFDIDVEIDAWKKFFIYSNYLYTAVDSEDYIGKKYSLLTPLTSVTNFNKPVDANESPIDVQVTANYVYFLLPGNISGENAKIYKFNLTGTYIETIDLTTINFISSFVVIDDSNIWAITDTAPTELIRIYNDGSWNYSSF